MEIKIIGSGCPTCQKLLEQTKQAVAEMKLDAKIEYSDDISLLVSLGGLQTPGLVIDGKLVLSGGVSNLEQLKDIIRDGSGSVANHCQCGGPCSCENDLSK